MIFRQWQQVLLEEKTQTRRIVKYGDLINTGDEQLWYMMRSAPQLGSMVQGGKYQIPTVVLRYKYKPYRIKWQVGRTYAVQPGRGKKGVGRIRLLDIRSEQYLQKIDYGDIKAEGIVKQLNWVSLDMREAFEQLWDSINTKKGDRWKDDPLVWPLTFQLVEVDNG